MGKGLLLVSGLLVSSMAFATDPVEIDNLINLKGAVVSTNRTHMNRDSTPLSISVIKQEEIETSNESTLLPILSERIPGLFVTEKGITGFGVSEGTTGTVNIRGVGQGNKALMLFDGQPQWAGLFSHSLPDTYVTSDVGKVEVVRGPDSLLHGSSTMGGVVNIITRQHNQPGRRTQAHIMCGSYNTQKYMINNGYNISNFSNYISLNHDHADGHRPGSRSHITNGFAKLGYKIDDRYKAAEDISLTEFEDQNPGGITNPLIDNIMNILRSTTSFALENNYGKTSDAPYAFYNWGHHKIDDKYNPGGTPSPYLFYSDDHNAGFLLYQSFRLAKGNSFTASAGYKNWSGHAWQDSVNGNQNELVNKTVNKVAGYVIIQQDLFDKVSLNAGVRYEYNNILGGEWTPRAGFTVRPFEGNVIKASLSKDFRSPNIQEMCMFPPQNPDLKPERMINCEVSIGQTFLGDNLSTELIAFFINGQDMIETTHTDGRSKNANTDTFANKGIEFDSRYQVLKSLSLGMNCSYLHTSKALLATPAHKFFAGMMYAPERFILNVNVRSIFDLHINTADKVKGDYTVLNTKAACRFGTRDRGLNLFVKGENLTAARYSINEGFPMPKAILMGGIDIAF